MPRPLNRREFDLFLSHAHNDREFVGRLDRWLTDEAGFAVWFDARDLGGGSLLASDLQNAIERCRGIVLVASGESLARGWVKAEYNAAVDERSNMEGFRVVALRVGDAKVDGLMRGTTWIDFPGPQLDAERALAVVHSLYPADKNPRPHGAHDVYISCSWHPDDNTSAKAVCHQMASQGFRLIGDAQDQKGFGTGDRVERIISSCGAFVGIIPYRDSERATKNDKPYKYFLRELDFAVSLDLPSVVIADPRVHRKDGSDEAWLRMETTADQCPQAVEAALNRLWNDWRTPPHPHYVFCALDLDSDTAPESSPVRNMIERITGLPTTVGNQVHENNIQHALVQKIAKAFLVVADITDDNLNTCIEAGMALAAGTNVELLARGKPRRPPFMLRGLQMPTYEDDVTRIGILHRILRPYRRRIINAEL